MVAVNKLLLTKTGLRLPRLLFAQKVREGNEVVASKSPLTLNVASGGEGPAGTAGLCGKQSGQFQRGKIARTLVLDVSDDGGLVVAPVEGVGESSQGLSGGDVELAVVLGDPRGRDGGAEHLDDVRITLARDFLRRLRDVPPPGTHAQSRW